MLHELLLMTMAVAASYITFRAVKHIQQTEEEAEKRMEVSRKNRKRRLVSPENDLF